MILRGTHGSCSKQAWYLLYLPLLACATQVIICFIVVDLAFVNQLHLISLPQQLPVGGFAIHFWKTTHRFLLKIVCSHAGQTTKYLRYNSGSIYLSRILSPHSSLPLKGSWRGLL